MTEKDLIRQLKELRETKPRKDWVVLTKSQILGEESPKWDLSPLFGWKLAFAPIISVMVIIGLFGFAQNTVPGDFLFSVKRIAEITQVGLSSTAEKPGVYLRLANKRLGELSKIAEANQVRNLSPAIDEFQTNISEAVQSLAEMDANVTGSDDPLALKEIVKEAQELKENKQEVEMVLGTQIGNTEELENALTVLEKRMAVYLIGDLEKRTLIEEDQILLAEAKEAFTAENYSLALEKLWLLSNK